MTKKETGQYIKQVRTKLGITQAEFAAMLYISPASMSKYETGISKVPKDILAMVKEVGREQR